MEAQLTTEISLRSQECTTGNGHWDRSQWRTTHPLRMWFPIVNGYMCISSNHMEYHESAENHEESHEEEGS